MNPSDSVSLHRLVPPPLPQPRGAPSLAPPGPSVSTSPTTPNSVDSFPTSSPSSASSPLALLDRADVAVVGRAADPFATENWEDEFQLNEEAGNGGGSVNEKRKEEDFDLDFTRDRRISLEKRQSLKIKSPIAQPQIIINIKEKEENQKEENFEDWDAEIAEEEAKGSASVVAGESRSRRNSSATATGLSLPAANGKSAAPSINIPIEDDWNDTSFHFNPSPAPAHPNLHALLLDDAPTPTHKHLHLSPANHLFNIINTSLHQDATQPHVSILTYPPPSPFLSLTIEGRSCMTEVAQMELLTNIVTKHKDEIHHRNNKSFDSSLLSLPTNSHHSIGISSSTRPPPIPSPTPEPFVFPHLLYDLLSFLSVTYRIQVLESTPPPQPPSAQPPPSNPSPNSNSTNSVDIWSHINRLFLHIDSRYQEAYISDWIDNPYCYSLISSVLHIASKSWTQAKAKVFFFFIQTTKKIFPTYSPLLELIEVETIAHHDGTKSSKLIRVLVSLWRRGALGCASIVKGQTGGLITSTTNTSGTSSSNIALLAAAQSLTSLHLYLSHYSPLTCQPLADAGQWTEENAINNNNMINNTINNNANHPFTPAVNLQHHQEPSLSTISSTTSSTSSPSLSDTDLDTLIHSLNSPTYRLSLLTPLYPFLPISMTRVKCAYVLGREIMAEENDKGLKVGEKYLMEAVYMIDQLSNGTALPIRRSSLISNQPPPPPPPLPSHMQLNTAISSNKPNYIRSVSIVTSTTPPPPPLLPPPFLPALTSLATLCLHTIGDCFLSLHKDLYAYAAYESACACYKVRKGIEWDWLVRRVAEVCVKREEWARAISYQKRIGERAKNEGNLNMYLYIAQELSKHYVLQGQYRKAEENLRTALTVLKPNNSPTAANNSNERSGSISSKSNNQHNSNNKSNTVDTADSSFSHLPPSDLRTATLTLLLTLARLYLDGDKPTQAISVLALLTSNDIPRSKQNTINLLRASALVKLKRIRLAEKVLISMESGKGKSSIGGSDVVHSVDYLVLRSKVYYHGGEYNKALGWIDAALAVCSSSSLAMLARLHYRKGKIYEAQLFDKIRSNSNHSNSSNLLLDPKLAITSFYTSYHSYSTLDSTLQMTKCLNHIVSIYLHISMVYLALANGNKEKFLIWLAEAEFDPKTGMDGFFSQVEYLAEEVLTESVKILKLPLLISAYLCMSELRWLQGHVNPSHSYWQAAADIFNLLFMNNSTLSLAASKNTPGYNNKCKSIMERLIRVGVVSSGKWLNARLLIIDSWLIWLCEEERERKRIEADEDEEGEKEKEKEQQKKSDPHPQNKRPTASTSSLLLDFNATFDAVPSSHEQSNSIPLPLPSPPSSSSRMSWTEQKTKAWGAVGSRALTPSIAAQTSVSLPTHLLSSIQLQTLSVLSEKLSYIYFEHTRYCTEERETNQRQEREYIKKQVAIFGRMKSIVDKMRVVCGDHIKEGWIPSSYTSTSGSSRISRFLANAHTLSDPLYPHLLYLLLLDGCVVLYHPHTHFKKITYINNSYQCSKTNTENENDAQSSNSSNQDKKRNPVGTAILLSQSSYISNIIMDRLVKEFNAGKPPHKHHHPPAHAVSNLFTHSKSQGEKVWAPRRTNESEVICNLCGCNWLTTHPFEPDLCRNCFHTHIVTASDNAPPPVSLGGGEELSEEESDEEDDADEEDELEDESEEWSDTIKSHTQTNHQTQTNPAMAGVPYSQTHRKGSSEEKKKVEGDDNGNRGSGGDAHPALVTDEEITEYEQSITATIGVRESTLTAPPSNPSPRHHTQTYDIDSLLPPSLSFPYFRELFASLDPQNLLLLIAALLSECRVLFISQSIYRLKACMTSVTRLTYPFYWQHSVIPLLNNNTLSMLTVTQPWLIGIHNSLYEQIYEPILASAYTSLPSNTNSQQPPSTPVPISLQSIVIIHLDNNTVKYAPGTFINLPAKCKNRLYKIIVKFQSTMFLLSSTPPNTINSTTNTNSNTVPAPLSQTENLINEEDLDNPLAELEAIRKGHLALRTLRDGFLSVFLSLFSSYPLFFTPSPSIPVSSPSSSAVSSLFSLHHFLYEAKSAYSTFLHVFVRTKSFRVFIAVRANSWVRKWWDDKTKEKLKEKEKTKADNIKNSQTSTSPYLFDSLVYNRLFQKYSQIQFRRLAPHSSYLTVSRGTKPYKRRFAVLTSDGYIILYAGQRNYEKKEKGKYMRKVDEKVRIAVSTGIVGESSESRSMFELIPITENNNTIMINNYLNKKEKISSVSSSTSAGTTTSGVSLMNILSGVDDSSEIWHVRCESEESCKTWVKLLQARAMSKEMRGRWEAIIGAGGN